MPAVENGTVLVCASIFHEKCSPGKVSVSFFMRICRTDSSRFVSVVKRIG
jgi:hypothetical protein